MLHNIAVNQTLKTEVRFVLKKKQVLFADIDIQLIRFATFIIF